MISRNLKRNDSTSFPRKSGNSLYDWTTLQMSNGIDARDVREARDEDDEIGSSHKFAIENMMSFWVSIDDETSNVALVIIYRNIKWR